ncbi:MAG: hypothetical protein WAK18_13495 [Nocardioidaceae bacterium]
MPHPAPRLLVAGLLALVGLGSPLSAGAVTADESARAITIKPASLERGKDPGIPQLLGKTIIDGTVRIKIAAQEVQLYGKSGNDYVVGVYLRNGHERVQRVAPDGSRNTIMNRINGDVVLSRDGLQVSETVVRPGAISVVTVRDAYTGDRLAHRTFHGYIRVLDAEKNRAILGGSAPNRTLWWRIPTDGIKRIATREGYFADIRADRVASFTNAPHAGACSILTTLSAPRRTLWRSCDQAVVASSPNGRRLLTQYIRMDGPVSRQSVHGSHGRLFVNFRTKGSFGRSAWGNNRSVLMQTSGTKKAAIVRCHVNACERASKLINATH